MMSSKSREELKELLQQATPDELMAQLGGSLDDDGRAYLEQRKREPEIEDFLRDSGRYTRELLDHPPEFRLPADFKWREDDPAPNIVRANFRRRLVGLMGIAAALVMGALLGYWQKPQVVFDSKGTTNFSRAVGEPGAEAVDRALFLALKTRGLFFLESAQKGGSLAHYEEAYKDLSQAYLLDQDDAQILEALRVIQPILQQNYDQQEP